MKPIGRKSHAKHCRLRKTKQGRCCRTDPIGNESLQHPGRYFPNFPCFPDSVDTARPLPAEEQSRDKSLDTFVEQHKADIVKVGRATGLLYIAFGNIKNSNYIREDSASTFWVLETNGKKFGITALHGIANENYGDDDFECFITPNPKLQHEDLSVAFFNRDSAYLKEFVKVELRFDLLEKVRRDYLVKLARTRSDVLVQENIDPEYGLQTEPTLDVLFFTLPAACSDQYEALQLSIVPPAPLSPTALIAYHDIRKEAEEDFKEEYYFTTAAPLQPSRALHTGRSVSLGKVIKVGTGLITVMCNRASRSSGGPYVDESMRVFAVSLGCFYDMPDSMKPDAPQRAPDFSMVHPSSFRLCDVVLPESGEQKMSKNRNIGLSVFHPGFRAMLASL